MFYTPGVETSGLPFNPFKACCVPRPIGWISTVDQHQHPNIAPYSQFQNVTWNPPTISIAINNRRDGSMKDTAANILETGEFGWSMATERHLTEVILTNHNLLPTEDEFTYAQLEKKAAQKIAAPLVAGAPVHFECKLVTSMFLPGGTPEASAHLIIGEVIGIHIDEQFLTEGRLDVAKMRPIARMGYLDFAVIESTIERTDLLIDAKSISFMKENV